MRIDIHDAHDIDNAELLEIVRVRVVQHLPYGGIGASHQPLHAVHCTQEMRFVNRLHPACADENVLKPVRNPDNLVRNYLSDRENHVIISLHEPVVDRNRNRIVDFSA